MKHNFDQTFDRRGTHSVKWDCLDRVFGSQKVLPMWVADMDFPAPEGIITSIQKRAAHGAFGYTERPASLNQAVVDWMKDRHGWDIRKEWIVYTPGVVNSLNLAIITYTNPGDDVLIQPPIYPPFSSSIKNNERNLVNNALRLENGRYRIDFEDLENKLASGVKMMMLCNPHNPVGRVWTQDELERIAKLCMAYDVLLISDEIHSDIIYKGHAHIPTASLSEEIAQNVITCIAPSKTFNVPGLAMSAVIIPNDQLRVNFKKTMRNIAIEGSNIFGMVAMEAAYTQGKEWLEQLLEYLQGNLEFLKDYMHRQVPDIKPIIPEGTYLVWLDCRDLGMDEQQLKRFMIDKAKVGLVNGADFGGEGQGFQRMNIACSRDTLKEGLSRLKRAVDEYKGR